jgi:hypothetical protein
LALTALSAILGLASIRAAHAREAESGEGSAVPCAVVSHHTGDVDLLDSTRTHLLKMGRGAAIPCGAWVSVKTGAIEHKHRDGFRIHLAKGAFAQLTESNTDGKNQGEQLVLFHGEVFAHAPNSSGELRVITSNARSRVKRGSAIVLYNEDADETQLIALDAPASIENRFEPSRKAQIAAGEASSLNFKLMRVVPSVPRAVAVSSLRPKFEGLRVPARERELALRRARERNERLFAAKLVPDEVSPEWPNGHPGRLGRHFRGPASAGPAPAPAKVDPKVYSAHGDEPQGQDAELHERFVNRVVAGAPGADHLLHPRKRAPRAHPPAQGRVIVKDQGTPSPEDSEKRRLIEELSRIRED